MVSIELALVAAGAGIAVGASGLASGIGAGIAGAAGAGVISEDPDKFSTALIFQALPQTQGIYGFLVAILILMGTGLLGGGELIELGLGNALMCVGAGTAVGVAGLSAIGQGIATGAAVGATAEKEEMFGKSMVFSVLPETQAIYGMLIAILILLGAGILGGGQMVELSPVFGLIGVGAGIAVGVAGLSAIGQGVAAGSAIGATAEKEEMFGKSMVFSVLPETQALYGFIISILLLAGTGLLGGSLISDLPLWAGIAAVGAGIAVGVAGLSAIGQGIAAGSSVGVVSEKEEMFGKGMVFSVLPETQAIYGMLIAILILLATGILGGGVVENLAPVFGLVAVGAGVAVGVAGLSAIGQGIASGSAVAATAENEEVFGKGMVFSVLPETQALYGFIISILLLAGTGLLGATAFPEMPLWVGIASVGAGVAVGVAGLSAIGQGIASGASVGVVSENEEMFGKSMVFSVLPETQAIYGMLIAILILLATGILGGAALNKLPLSFGYIALGAGVAVGVAGLSAIGQGIASGASVGVVSENEEMFGKGMVFSVLPETQALYGFIIAILLLAGTGLLGAAALGELGIGVGIAGIGAGIAVGVAGLSAIGQGMAAGSSVGVVSEKEEMFGKGMVFSVLPETQAIYGMLIAILILLGAGILGGGGTGFPTVIGLVCIGAGVAVGVAGLSAIGQGIAAGSSVGVVSENEEMFGKGMVFSVLPETQALYGFIISILLLAGSGVIGGAITGNIDIGIGIAAIGAGASVGIAGLSAIGQGIASGSSVGVVSENEEMFGKGMVFSVLPETQAIYGMLIAILILLGAGILGGKAMALPTAIGYVAVGAGIAVGVAGLSAIGQGIASGASINAVSEKQEIFGKSMVFSVLPETQALYGFIIAILLLATAGLVGGAVAGEMELGVGIAAIGAGASVGLAGLSAIGQGIVAGGAVGATAKDPDTTGRGLVLSVIPETYAIFGLLISILIMLAVGLFG